MACFVLFNFSGDYSECYECQTFEVGLDAFLLSDVAISLWGLGSGIWWFECNWPHKLIGNDTIRRCSLVKGVWSCWRKCVSVAVGFESSYMLKFHSV